MAVSDFIDTSIEDEIIQLGQELSTNYWKIGRLVIRAIEQTELLRSAVIAGRVRFPREKVDELMQQTVMQIYQHFAMLAGKSSKRIQEYVTCARFYPDEVVEAYDMLPFDHFDFARQFGPRWRDVLDFSVRQIEQNNGRPRSVDWLRAKFQPGDQGQTFEQVLEDHANRAYFDDTISVVETTIAEQPGNTAAMQTALRRLEMAVGGLAGLVNGLPLSEPQKTRWQLLVQQMSEFIRDCQGELT